MGRSFVQQAAGADRHRDSVADLRGQAARKRLALRLSMPPDLPLVRGDAEQLLQFFSAVFLPAIENTPDGGRVSLDIERGEGCAIVLSIAGSGTDVLCEEIDAIARLFARFGSLQSDSAAGPGRARRIAIGPNRSALGSFHTKSSLNLGLR